MRYVTPVARTLPASTLSPAEFIEALHEIKDWYEFSDRTADPFVKTPAAGEAIPALILLLDDPSEQVRTRAVSTLGKIRQHPDRIIPALIPLLNDEAVNVRWHAAFAIGNFGPEAKMAIPELLRQVNNPKSPIGAFSANMLRKVAPDLDMEPALIRFRASDLKTNRSRAVEGLQDSDLKKVKLAMVRAYEEETDTELRDRMARAIAQVDAQLQQKDVVK